MHQTSGHSISKRCKTNRIIDSRAQHCSWSSAPWAWHSNTARWNPLDVFQNCSHVSIGWRKHWELCVSWYSRINVSVTALSHRSRDCRWKVRIFIVAQAISFYKRICFCTFSTKATRNMDDYDTLSSYSSLFGCCNNLCKFSFYRQLLA